MCSNERPAPAPPPGLLPYPLAALKHLNEAAAAAAAAAAATQAQAQAPAQAQAQAPGSQPSPAPSAPAPNLLPLDHYRLQLYNYAMAERLRFSQHYPAPLPLYPAYPGGYAPRLAFSMSLFHQRALQPEEPKPQHSYIGLIAMAILSSPDHKLVLSDIYQYILDNYPYFRTRGPGWRNSIRHNLSLNDCFIKAGRSANGKGHYWAIHPANVDDFKKGDFRRRKAQRKVRKHMGLAVDEEGNDSPSPPPAPASPPVPAPAPAPAPALCWAPPPALAHAHAHAHGLPHATGVFPALPCPGAGAGAAAAGRKRQFDVASLLAPDDDDEAAFGARKAPRCRPALPPPPPPPPLPPAPLAHAYASSGDEDAADEDIDVVSSDQEAKEDAPPPPPPQPAQPPPHAPWAPAHGAFALEQQLVSRYYEQLAQQQQQQQQQQQRRLLQTPQGQGQGSPTPQGPSPPPPPPPPPADAPADA